MTDPYARDPEQPAQSALHRAMPDMRLASSSLTVAPLMPLFGSTQVDQYFGRESVRGIKLAAPSLMARFSTIFYATALRNEENHGARA